MTMEVIDSDVFPLIERSQMPQISSKQYTLLLVFLGSRGVSFSAGYISPHVLNFRQEVDVEVAMGLPAEKLAKPILLAVGNYVLDGDHRGYRHQRDGTDAPYIRLSTTFDEAKELLFQFPGTLEEITPNDNGGDFPLLPAPGEA